VVLHGSYPINVLNRVKMVGEVASVYCATANPVVALVGDIGKGRGILGVIDGVRTKGIEAESDKKERRDFLRKIGYKRYATSFKSYKPRRGPKGKTVAAAEQVRGRGRSGLSCHCRGPKKATPLGLGRTTLPRSKEWFVGTSGCHVLSSRLTLDLVCELGREIQKGGHSGLKFRPC
jgi:hypothetical protein